MIRHIVHITTAVFMLLVPLATTAQQLDKRPHIVFLGTGSERIHGKYVDVLRKALRDKGYADGRNIVLDYRFGDGKRSLIRAHVAEFVRQKVDVILSAGLPPAQEAAKATRAIPIVVTFAGDLVGSGLAASLARPGGNVTGLTSLAVDLSAKRLQLLKEAVPSVSRVAMLFNPTPKAGMATVQRTRAAAAKFGVAIFQAPVRRQIGRASCRERV